MSTTPTISLGKLSLKPRITVKNLRRLKEDGGIDFTSSDTETMLGFLRDPIVVVMAVYQVYLDQFETSKMTEDDLKELCGNEEIELLRSEVDQQMRSFSNLWKIVSTEMEALQSGDTSLLDRAKDLPAMQAAVSGRSS